jgi:chorismate synthase
MNSFGKIFRINIFGESHGNSVGVAIDGCPAGLLLNEEDFVTDMERRKGGIQKGTTPRKEDDIPIFKSGLFNNLTTGAPLTMIFENNNIRSADYRGSGHFSGRLTVALVAAGVIAKKILEQVEIVATLIEVAGEKNTDAGLQKAIDAKDSVGGIIECKVNGLPVGLGEPFFDSVESLISHAVFAIPAVRGIEFGTGFEAAKMFGVDHNDSIEDIHGKTSTNHAGGVVGGLTNGNELVFRLAIKPTSSTPKEQLSLNWTSGEIENFSVKGRHDLCIALRVPVIVEAVTAFVIADLMLMENRIPRILPQFS